LSVEVVVRVVPDPEMSKAPEVVILNGRGLNPSEIIELKNQIEELVQRHTSISIYYSGKE
jgi:hypothetical protein